MKKFYKIGEISKLYHIAVDSIRYYEEIGIIHPERSESGYRLYSVNDIWRLNVIRELRELDFSMERIRQYLDSHSVKSTLDLLEEEENAILERQKKLQKMQKNVERRMKTIRSAEHRPLMEVSIGALPPRRCHCITEGYSDEHEMDVLIKRLLNIDKKHFYIIGNNQIGTFLSLREAQTTGELRYRAVFLVDEAGTETIPGGNYLSICYRGDYGKSRECVKILLDYATGHYLKPVGDVLELLWIDIHTTSKTAEQVTELQLRVEP